MNDSVLERVSARRLEERVASPDTDQPEDLGCFGWLRGIRDRAVMLELRKRDGNILAIGYAWLERVEFDPSVGITLHACGREIVIQGVNLNCEVRPNVRLFDGIVRHRVPWVRESDRLRGMTQSESAAVIHKITL